MSDDPARERRFSESGGGADATDERDETDATAGGRWSETPAVLRRKLLQAAGIGAVLGGSTDQFTGGTLAAVPGEPAERYPTEATRRVRSVAASGDAVLVVTGPRPDRPSARPALASLLRRDGPDWRRVASVEPPDGTLEFGSSAAVGGGTALVGSPSGSATATRAGSVTVLSHDGEGNWRLTDDLRPATPTGIDRFGAAVALAEDTVLAGAPTATDTAGSRSGAVAVFGRSTGGWRREDRLLPRGADRFGRAVALTRDRAVVGARIADATGDDAGVVTVFTRHRSGWRRRSRLLPPAARRASRDDRFGASVAASGDTVVVGAPTETNEWGDNAGAVYVFDARGRTRLTALDAASDDRFGTAVATADGRIVVGADRGAEGWSGAVTVFERRRGRWQHVGSPRPASGLAVAADGRAPVAGGRPGTEDGPGVFEL